MACATQAPLQVRSPKPRAARPPYRRSIFKVFAGGIAIVAVGFIAVLTVTAGVGWLLAVSLEARSDHQSVAALTPPSRRLAWVDLPAPATESATFVLASYAPDETIAPVETEEPAVADAPAEAMDSMAAAYDPSADQTYVGSIGAYSSKKTALEVAAAVGPETSTAPDGPRPIPLPRTRPRLASLGPVEGLGIKPEEESHPPRTAIYDITAQMVYLPNGERLEAHSGLGPLMDDPRNVHQKNRGPTPPNTYNLTLRESLFHGVKAIRLTPVAESGMFGRDGILAHSYMLGPNGQSNGCVSFRDYPKFLQAYLRGEFDRIVVVPRLARSPTFATRSSTRSAANLF